MDEKEMRETTEIKWRNSNNTIPEDVIVVDLDDKSDAESEKKDNSAEQNSEAKKEKDIIEESEVKKDEPTDEKKESENVQTNKQDESEKEQVEKKDKPEKEQVEKKDKPETDKLETKKEEDKDKASEAKNDDKREDSEEKKDEESKEVKEQQSEEQKEKDDTEKPEEKKEDKIEDKIEDSEPIVIPVKKSSKKVWGVVFGCLLAVILIAYAAGFIYFSGHFYQDVTVNGIPVSGFDEEQAKQKLNGFYSDYFLTIHTINPEKNIEIKAKDIAMQIQMKDEFAKCFQSQQPYLWFVNMFHKFEFQVGANTSWDADKLEEFYHSCEALDKKKMVKPEDAYVGVDETGKFAIIKEVVGNSLSEKKFKSTVETALSDVMSDVDLKEKGCYSLPKVYADNEALVKELEAKSVYSDCDIKIKLDDLLIEPGMELYEAVLKKNGDAYDVDDSLVKKYVKGLADQYDSLGKERDFTTSFDGKHIKLKSDNFGYELNQEQLLADLSSAIKTGKPTTIEAQFYHKGASLLGDNDIGNTYIEVNLSEQRVIAYENGKKIAEGDCVSGNEAAGHGTCTGLYAIQSKQSPAVLRGEKVPVTKTVTKKKKGKKVKVQETTYEYDYESPVTFWMPFNGGIGLHDATAWRSAYGGSIYRYSGSHGCVNLPYGLAETLYKTYDVGTPVIVYFWDNENRK